MDGGNPADDPNEANKIKSEGLKFVFMGNRDNFPYNPCPYSDDGNPDMYTAEKMEIRRNLKSNELVKEAINDFMGEFQKNAQGDVSKEEYVKVFMKIGMILRPGIEADDLQKIVKEDFELDSMDKVVIKDEDKDDPKKAEQAQQDFELQPQKQYDYLTSEKLYDALFTLADTWCPSVSEIEYQEFFKQLKYRLKYHGMKDNQAYGIL